MPSRQMKSQGFAVCIRNAGFGASLELRKLYPVLDDPDAEANDLIRVIDESGEDYVYPARLFQRLKLPAKFSGLAPGVVSGAAGAGEGGLKILPRVSTLPGSCLGSLAERQNRGLAHTYFLVAFVSCPP